MLQLLRPLPDIPWRQLPEEDDAEYAFFLLWLMSDPRDAPTSPVMADRFSWSRRAKAYDTWTAQPKSAKDSLQEIAKNLLAAATIDAKRLVQRTRMGEADPMSAAQLLQIVQWLSQAEAVLAAQDTQQTFDATKFSKDQLRLLEKSTALLQRLK